MQPRGLKHLWIIFLLVMSGSMSSYGQVSDSLAKKIDAIFSDLDKTNSPGCALAVLRDGKIIYKRGYGMSNLEYGIAISPSSIFHVASISKQFTAAAIQRLALEGKLSLADDVRKYIPEMPAFGATITLGNLVHHTSGLRDQWDLQALAGWRDDDLITEDDVMEMLTRQQALNFVPGAEFVYCNTGFTLLGIVVKRVTGVSLRHYADSVFFQPLGMTATHFHSDHREVVPNRTSAYYRDDSRWAIDIPVFDNYGATSLFTTVEDLAKWDENFYTARVGGAGFIAAMLKPGVFNDGTSQNYASGLATGQYKGHATVEHSGSDAGYRANFLRFPDDHFSVIVLANLANINTGNRCRQVADIFLKPGKGEVWKVVIVDTTVTAKWAGDYLNPVSKARISLAATIARGFNSGYLAVNGVQLRAVSDSVFAYPDNETEYKFRMVGGKVRLTVRPQGNTAGVFEKVKKIAVAPAALTEYTGVFYSKELDVWYTIFVKDSALQVKMPRHEAMGLEAYVKDIFTGWYLVEFQRDKKGRVNGFLVTTGRSRNIRFEKERDLEGSKK